MRTVLNSIDTVTHYWANQIQPRGRAGNVFFEGPTIYSYGYHFPIATIFPGRGVAFTTRSYSVTTSGHISRARRASMHLNVISVHDPASRASSQLFTTMQEVNGLLTKAKRARANKSFLLADAANLVRGFNTYAEWRGEDCRIDTDLSAIEAEIERAEAIRKQAADAAAKARDEANREAIEEWLRGRSNYCPHTAKPRLRLFSPTGDASEALMVQTSWGACIPSEDALRLWPLILRTMKGERDYEVGMALGDYRLNKIRRDGSIVVGCHEIEWSEISRIAELLMLFEGTETETEGA